jgi:glycosyltransferase involved in cell wall biosynthesis
MPCYNEAETIPHTLPQVRKTLAALVKKNTISNASKMLFVDDGSEDSTWQVIETSAKKDTTVSGIKLSRNSGHQMAMLAGMEIAKNHADIVITMDVDLQDDLAAIKDMVKAYNDGSDVIFGVRSSRKKDNLIKRLEARSFYGLMERMGAKTINDHADFRLMSANAIEKLSEHKFAGMQLRGLVPGLGLNTSIVYYERKAREHGKVQYTFLKLLTLAMDGITQFSIKPIQVIFIIATFLCITSLAATTFFIILAIITSRTIEWLGLIACLITFLASIQLFAIWLVGEYAGRAYMAAKCGRILYNIDKVIGIKNG